MRHKTKQKPDKYIHWTYQVLALFLLLISKNHETFFPSLSPEPILCISNDLVCDKIKQCPLGDEMYSDEDSNLCRPFAGSGFDTANADMTIWQQLSLGFLKNMFGMNEVQPPQPQPQPPFNHHHNYHYGGPAFGFPPPTLEPPVRPPPPPPSSPSVTRGLAKYGPWGYLMLGMLLCGAALLICGLWGEF